MGGTGDETSHRGERGLGFRCGCPGRNGGRTSSGRTTHERPSCILLSIAARFSPDGRHLAAINAFGLLYLVPKFTRVDHEIVSFSDIVRRVYFGQPLRHLVWDGQPNRLVVQADSYEIFIVNVNPGYHSPDGDRDYQGGPPTSFSDPFERMSVLRLVDFGGRAWRAVTCR